MMMGNKSPRIFLVKMRRDLKFSTSKKIWCLFLLTKTLSKSSTLQTWYLILENACCPSMRLVVGRAKGGYL